MGTLHWIHIKMDSTVLADENAGQDPKITFVLCFQNDFFFTLCFVITFVI